MLAMKVYPISKPYGAYNVNNGFARPETWTNIWISDPNKGLPQSVTLDFTEEIEFNTVYLTFDTFLHKRIHEFPPHYRVPQCVKDYEIWVFRKNKWKRVFDVRDNYYRFRVHKFTTVSASRLMLKILSTNGDASARVYQIRVYKE